MRNFYDWVLDEKIVLGFMSFTFAAMAMVLIWWGKEQAYVMIPFGIANQLVGALLRGITHQPGVSDSTQSVSSTTTVTPKEP